MFRCSSKRALSSTRQTAWRPSSATSIKAGTTGESPLVRYTVVFRVITAGSRAASRTKRSKVVTKES